MSRLQQNRIIDTAIKRVASITKDQCSLSETDLIVLNEALERLQFLKRKKGKTNGQIQNEIIQIICLLNNFFTKD